MFTSQTARQFGEELRSNAVVCIQEANVSAVGDAHVLIIAKAELMEAGAAPAAEPAAVAAVAAAAPTAAAPGAVKQEPEAMQTDVPAAAPEAAAKTPAAALKSSAALAKSSPYATPANHPTPPSAAWYAPARAHVPQRNRSAVAAASRKAHLNSLGDMLQGRSLMENTTLHGWAGS